MTLEREFPMTAATLPVLFISHGAPLFAIEAGSTGPALTRWGEGLQLPENGLRGIVIMSPHWMARSPAVMSNPAPATWHDFGGFPPALYELQYPAPGSPALAADVLGLLREAGMAADSDAERPLDHGAWVPLMHLFPRRMYRWCKWLCRRVTARLRCMPWAARCAACGRRACCS